LIATYTVPSSGNSNANAAPIIAPGAENIGQAQILSEYSKPFHLEGIFGDADEGAFGGRKDDEDTAMLADEDGDIFWDAVEGPYSEAMDEDG
jgi:nuclear GTP-binding protein